MNDLKSTISYNDFAKLDFRVGTVVQAKDVEESEKLIKLSVDFGEEIGSRTIFAGIKGWYSPEDLVGKQTVFLVNLEPKPMPGGESQGMLFAADGEDDKPELISFEGKMDNGASLL